MTLVNKPLKNTSYITKALQMFLETTITGSLDVENNDVNVWITVSEQQKDGHSYAVCKVGISVYLQDPSVELLNDVRKRVSEISQICVRLLRSRRFQSHTKTNEVVDGRTLISHSMELKITV